MAHMVGSFFSNCRGNGQAAFGSAALGRVYRPAGATLLT
jgi:hypothetical protein